MITACSSWPAVLFGAAALAFFAFVFWLATR